MIALDRDVTDARVTAGHGDGERPLDRLPDVPTSQRRQPIDDAQRDVQRMTRIELRAARVRNTRTTMARLTSGVASASTVSAERQLLLPRPSSTHDSADIMEG